MTTISSRVQHLELVISSLLAQDRKPDTIALNVSDHPYLLDEGINFLDLPPLVRRLATSGSIELNFVPNIGSYRKLIPTLRRYQTTNCLIVTADDDARYPTRWLSGLIEAYERHRCVAAYRCRLARSRGSSIESYDRWPLITHGGDALHCKLFTEPHMFAFPTGRGGVLYHTSFFPDLSVLDEFRQLAPAQDDLAFRMATFIAGVPVIAVPLMRSGTTTSDFGGPPVSVELWKRNLHMREGQSDNDKALAAIFARCFERRLLPTGSSFGVSVN